MLIRGSAVVSKIGFSEESKSLPYHTNILRRIVSELRTGPTGSGGRLCESINGLGLYGEKLSQRDTMKVARYEVPG